MTSDKPNTPFAGTSARRAVLRVAVLGAGLLALGACTENLDTSVTRFSSQLPPPTGQSFFIEPDDPALTGGIEFGQYASQVAAHLVKLGYQPAPSAEAATLIVHFDYGVDKGREKIRSTGPDPYWGPWHGYRGWGPYWGGGYYGPRGPWGWGWYDPWFDSGVESYTVYTSGISLKIDQKADAAHPLAHLFEGRAEAVSSSNRLPYLVPNLVEAMFTGFPGNSGQTVRITVAPEPKAKPVK